MAPTNSPFDWALRQAQDWLRANGTLTEPFDWAHDRPFVLSTSKHERRLKNDMIIYEIPS